MAGHTPGPWFVPHRTHRTHGTYYVEARLQGSTLQEVAACGPTEAWGQQEANARLIATTPDLLADLTLAAATLRRYEQAHRAKGTEESTAKAEVNAALAARFEATIAEAEGRDHG